MKGRKLAAESVQDLSTTPGVSNRMLAELLARKAEEATGHWQRALRRAARAAFLWPVEAGAMLQAGRSLTELPAIGPSLEKLLRGWLADPPAAVETPPIRRSFLTRTDARRVLRQHPAWAGKYKGDLQMHSTWSDGSSSIRAMAMEGLTRGYQYLAITDHSKGLKIAGGIDESELAAQAAEMQQVETNLARQGRPIRLLRSVELNLSPTGEGDMDPAALNELDLVVGSFHSVLRKTEDQTTRYLAAIRNPQVHILGHPRGRIYNHRLGLVADWEKVFAEAARLDKAVEVDSYPDRQDLDVELLVLARQAGVRIAIDTDAHSPEQLGFAEFGLAAALLAGIPAESIVNFLAADDLLAWADAVGKPGRKPAKRRERMGVSG